MTAYEDDRHRRPQESTPGERGGFRRLETFFVMPDIPCPYLPGRLERKVVTQLAGAGAKQRYDLLSRAGFRRSHTFAYRPACEGCEACVAVRIQAKAYRPGQTLRRIARRNGDLVLGFRPARATEEQFALFRRYLAARHHDGEMADMTAFEFRQMVDESAVESQIAELRLPDGHLLAACLIDWLDDGLSAVYSFFEPDCERRGLGNLIIHRLVEETARRDLPYLYLGYWIEGARKMAYKTRFRPLEGLKHDGWRLIE